MKKKNCLLTRFSHHGFVSTSLNFVDLGEKKKILLNNYAVPTDLPNDWKKMDVSGKGIWRTGRKPHNFQQKKGKRNENV